MTSSSSNRPVPKPRESKKPNASGGDREHRKSSDTGGDDVTKTKKKKKNRNKSDATDDVSDKSTDFSDIDGDELAAQFQKNKKTSRPAPPAKPLQQQPPPPAKSKPTGGRLVFERADSGDPAAAADKSGTSLTGANWPISFGDISTSSTAGVLNDSSTSFQPQQQQRQPPASTSSPTRKAQSENDLLSTSGDAGKGPGKQQRQPTAAGGSAESLPATRQKQAAAPTPKKRQQKQPQPAKVGI